MHARFFLFLILTSFRAVTPSMQIDPDVSLSSSPLFSENFFFHCSNALTTQIIAGNKIIIISSFVNTNFAGAHISLNLTFNFHSIHRENFIKWKWQ